MYWILCDWWSGTGTLLAFLASGGNSTEAAPGVHIEPAASNVERPRLPDVETNQPMHDDVVEYPNGAPGDLVREMKESDPSYRKRLVESAPSQPRKPGELKIARQEPIRASSTDGPAMMCVCFQRHPGVLHGKARLRSAQVGPTMDVEGSGVKREAEQSV